MRPCDSVAGNYVVLDGHLLSNLNFPYDPRPCTSKTTSLPRSSIYFSPAISTCNPLENQHNEFSRRVMLLPSVPGRISTIASRLSFGSRGVRRIRICSSSFSRSAAFASISLKGQFLHISGSFYKSFRFLQEQILHVSIVEIFPIDSRISERRSEMTNFCGSPITSGKKRSFSEFSVLS